MEKCSVVYHYCSLWLPGNKRRLVSGVLLFRGFFCGEMDGCLMPSIITFPSSLCSADWRGRKRVSSSGQAKREKNVRTRFWPISPSPLPPFPILHTPYRESPPSLPLSSQGSKGGGSCLLALQACGRGRKGQIDKLTKKTSHFLCASFSPTAMIKTKFGLN